MPGESKTREDQSDVLKPEPLSRSGPTSASKREGSKAEEIPERIKKLRKQWLSLHRTWWSIHYLVGLGGVIAGVVAGALGSGSDESSWVLEGGWVAGVIAATATSIVTFLGPHQKAQVYWKAYHAIDHACFLYEGKELSFPAFGRRVEGARKIVTVGLSDIVTEESLENA